MESLRIVYITSKKRWGGVSSWMQRTALGLQDRGHQVWIVAHPRGRFVATASDGLRIISRKAGMDYNPRLIAYLVGLIRRHGIQLVVTNIEKEVIAGGLAARLCGIANIRRVGREDDFNTRFKVKWHHRLLVDACIVPCNRIRDNACKRAPWLDPDQFSTIYNGKNKVVISQEQIRAQRSQWGVAADEMVLGITSQLSPKKGVDGLIGVFARLATSHGRLRLVITGEGTQGRRLQQLAARLGVGDKVVFAGFSPHPMQAAAAYDIAVCNSLFDGFPNTVVEYFAAGRPVVTTDAGGIDEMVVHEHNGWIVPQGDDEALYQGLRRLIDDRPLRERLARGAAATIDNGFSEDHMLAQLEDLYLHWAATSKVH
jgi:glycosyltransferase involved in cell wall biosynthesis